MTYSLTRNTPRAAGAVRGTMIFIVTIVVIPFSPEIFALNLDDSRLAVTGAGLASLGALPHLTALSFDAKDADMPYIAALPRLRHLVCQDTVAGDDGFSALGGSRSLVLG